MIYLKAFITGGVICLIAQILIDNTSLNAAKVLVLYVAVGAIISAVGLYDYLVKFGSVGATIPLTGFGHSLAQGVIKEVEQEGALGILTGGLKTVAGGITTIIVAGYLNAIIFSPKTKD